MAIPHNKYEPISRLDRDVLWHIFSINADSSNSSVPYWSPPSDPQFSPLAISRRLSQVCRFWRRIILESSSIWGKCLDLDLLRQRNDRWRREVLRRAGTALLVVRARTALMHNPHVGVQKWLIDIISDYWTRIGVLDIVIGSSDILKSPKVQSALRRPAPHLRLFAIQNASPPGRSGSGFMAFPETSPLFANDSPLLTDFSIGSGFVTNSSIVPFPSILLKGQLRRLTVDQPLVIPAHSLLAACAQMPLLEELSINIAILALKKPHESTPSVLSPVSLPNLRVINIGSFCLDTYPEFLGRILPSPDCRWDINTVATDIETPNKAIEIYAREIYDIHVRYMSGFFATHSTGPSCPTHLSLSLTQGQLCLAAHQKKDSFSDAYVQTTFDEYTNSVAIHTSFARALSSFTYPASLTQFRFVSPNLQLQEHIPPLAPFFFALESIKELYTSVDGLSFIMSQWAPKERLFFPVLETLFLVDPSNDEQRAKRIVPFFSHRLQTSPILNLNLAESPYSFGDLRLLDEITGLKVIWRSEDDLDSQIMEYVCGSGTPRLLSTV
ncbi:hypothetical protein BJ912DRAFT_1060657 [Pholiota molesta]|nr:hypothetical protein BJ912DRAFT_1060657 [Pholiota molesta]